MSKITFTLTDDEFIELVSNLEALQIIKTKELESINAMVNHVYRNQINRMTESNKELINKIKKQRWG